MSDHDVVANFNCKQGSSLSVGNRLAEYAASGIEDSWKPPGQIRERDRRREQRIEPLVLQQRDCGREATAMRPPWPV
jgi:hypothetical protein